MAVGHLAVTWWGHASATIEVGRATVAIDPLLSDRLAHLRRYTTSPPESAYEADVVLISHLHGDHLHRPSLRRFPRDTRIVVPRGGERLLAGLGSHRLLPASPGDTLSLAGLTITVLPATHDGRRGPHSLLWAPPLGFRVAGEGRSFWFPGDTELRQDMAEVGRVDLALVPIGGWGPTLADGHMTPDDAAEAVRRVGATSAVPVHWGTFWPVALRRLAPANHHRLFVTPGDRFLDALAGVDVEAVLVEPCHRVTLAGPGFTRIG